MWKRASWPHTEMCKLVKMFYSGSVMTLEDLIRQSQRIQSSLYTHITNTLSMKTLTHNFII